MRRADASPSVMERPATSPDIPPRCFWARRQARMVTSPAHATASAQLGRENRNTNTASMTARYIPSRMFRCRFVFPAANVPEYWLVFMGANDSTATPAMQRVTTGTSFSHPKEGFNIFIDAMCIPKGCQNKEGAEAFINFLCRPDISAANLDYIGYSTPETAAKDYLDEEVTSSPVSYPDDETLARSESFAELGVEATQVMNDLWLSVKTSTSNTTLYLILTIAAIAAVILFFVISGIVRRRKKARRCRKWKQA